jgi:hypothetical protein
VVCRKRKVYLLSTYLLPIHQVIWINMSYVKNVYNVYPCVDDIYRAYVNIYIHVERLQIHMFYTYLRCTYIHTYIHMHIKV